jgi:hypothetical protein
MRFIYRGEFSKNMSEQTAMRVTFRGREPSEVTDAAAINWMTGHPDYEMVADAPEPAPKKRAKRK